MKPKKKPFEDPLPVRLQSYPDFERDRKEWSTDDLIKLITREGEMTVDVYMRRKVNPARQDYIDKRTPENLKKWEQAVENFYARLSKLKRIQKILEERLGVQGTLFEQLEKQQAEL